MDREAVTNSSFYILVFIWSFLLAVLVSSFAFISPLVGALLIFVGISVIIAEKVLGKTLNKEVLFISLALISFGIGSMRYSVKDFHIDATPNNTGLVVSEPERRDNATRFVFKADNGEKVLVNTDLYSAVEYGDQVILERDFKKPEIIEDFDYPAYLEKDDIYYTSFSKVEIVSKGNGNPILSILFKFKQGFVHKIRDILPEPESSLLAGLLVAGKDAMPKNILEEFKRAGVIHIVVLSGYNLTIIAESIRSFLFYTLPRFALPGSIAGIVLFILMIGAEATVLRAGLMVLAVILAKHSHRKTSPYRVLLATAFLMVLHNPKILVFDPSFQLSFLATLALVYVAPLVEKYLSKAPEKFGVKSMLATTLATQIVVLPYLIYSMESFSLVSLPANALILLFIPGTMLVGFVATVVGFVSSILTIPLAYITHLLLSYILLVSNILGNLSFATIVVPPISIWFVLVIYLALIRILIYLKTQKAKEFLR